MSPGERARIREACGPDPFVLFTPNFAARGEYEAALADGRVRLTFPGLHLFRTLVVEFAKGEDRP